MSSRMTGVRNKQRHYNSKIDHQFTFNNPDELLDRFSTPFWLGIGASSWTEEQKPLWRGEIAKLITDEEKEKGAVPAYM